MNIYCLSHNYEKEKEFQELLLEDDANTKKLLKLLDQGWINGKSIKNDWFEINVVLNEETQDLKPSDFPSLPGFYAEPVFSFKAIEVLNELLQDNGEILPLVCEQGQYFVFNTTKVVDVLDENCSTFRPLIEIDPEIFDDAFPEELGITQYNFIPEKLEGLSIFRIPYRRNYKTNLHLVTDRFVEQVQRNNLLGFEFELLWNST